MLVSFTCNFSIERLRKISETANVTLDDTCNYTQVLGAFHSVFSLPENLLIYYYLMV